MVVVAGLGEETGSRIRCLPGAEGEKELWSYYFMGVEFQFEKIKTV